MMFKDVKNRRELSSEDLRRMRIPDRYWRVSFDNIQDSQVRGIEETFRALILRYMQKTDEVIKEGAGLILWGDNGTGKTSASVVIGKEFRRRSKTVLFMPASELKQKVVDHERFDEDETVWERAKSVDILVLDDFGKGVMDSTGFGATLFDELIRARNSYKLITIITSNLPVSEWHDELDLKKSTMRTLKECTIPIEVLGRDLRNDNAERLVNLLVADV